MRGGVGLGQPPVDVGGLLDRGQGLLPAAQPGQQQAEVVQRHREVGLIGGRVGLGQPPVGADGVLGRGESLPVGRRWQAASA